MSEVMSKEAIEKMSRDLDESRALLTEVSKRLQVGSDLDRRVRHFLGLPRYRCETCKDTGHHKGKGNHYGFCTECDTGKNGIREWGNSR